MFDSGVSGDVLRLGRCFVQTATGLSLALLALLPPLSLCHCRLSARRPMPALRLRPLKGWGLGAGGRLEGDGARDSHRSPDLADLRAPRQITP